MKTDAFIEGVRFRRSLTQDECHASECEIICHDFAAMGHPRVLVDPEVTVVYLVEQGYCADDVVTDRTDVPEVWWTSDDGVSHRYFVDIFIPAENRMIEVKSEYTASFYGVAEKASASRDKGFEFEMWVYGANGVRLNTAE